MQNTDSGDTGAEQVGDPTQTPLLTHTPYPTPTQTPEPFPTPEPTQPSSSTPTQAVISGIVRRFCPELQPPLGLFFDPEPFYDSSTNPATLYVVYQVVELGSEPPGKSCLFYLSPPPMGAPQVAGDSLYWKSFDEVSEWMMVWKFDPNYEGVDGNFPRHPFLRQTRTNTSFGKAGLYDFVIAEDGESLVWSYTDPRPYDDDQMGYVQEINGAATSGPIDQRPPVEIFFDFVPEGVTGAVIIRPLEISSDGERVFFSQEPVGLGRQWPEPVGRYSSLYSISTWWDVVPPVLHFDCGKDFWCISDFSANLDILVSVQGGEIQIRELSSGEMIRSVQAPEAYPLTRQALIGPDGVVAFLGVSMGEASYGDPPEDAAIFTIEPPYQDEPILVLSDPGLLNLSGWASPDLLLADGNNTAETVERNRTLPAHLILVDVDTREGTWLSIDADLFVSLVY